MRRLALAAATALFLSPAVAQTPGGSSVQSNLALVAPTAPASDNSNRVATTSWVRANAGTLVSSLNGVTGAVTTSVVKQVFTTSGTYTPTSGMISAIIECLGGGGGGGSSTGNASFAVSGGGGGSGSYSRKYVTAADIGASKVVTIGAAGVGALSSPGTAGGDTSVGSLCIGKGGAGGANGTSAQFGSGGAGGVAGTGDFVSAGTPGSFGYYSSGVVGAVVPSGTGAASVFGGGAAGITAVSATAQAGTSATGRGGGGSGAQSNFVATNAAGGNGSAGVVVVTEFLTQ